MTHSAISNKKQENGKLIPELFSQIYSKSLILKNTKKLSSLEG